MKFRVKIIKKNQLLTWGLIAVLVTAGYLNYTNDPNRMYITEVANNYEPELGDAVFVDSNNLVTNTKDLIMDVKGENFKTTSTEFFSENRINRNKLYAEQLESYEEILKKMPKVNSEINSPKGIGTVVYNDILRERVSVKVKTGEDSFTIYDFSLIELSGETPEIIEVPKKEPLLENDKEKEGNKSVPTL